MKISIKNLFPNFKYNKSKNNQPLNSASTSNHNTAVSLLGRPIFTPRNYENLAREGYLTNVIVYRCITLIAKGLASVPWLLYEKQKNALLELENHELLEILNCPSPKQAGSSLMENIVSHLLLSGNAYIAALKNSPGGNVLELHALRPDRMRIIPVVVGVEAYEYRVGSEIKIYGAFGKTNAEVLHLKQFHPLNDWYGMSPIEAAAQSIDQHNAVCAHNLALLQNGGRPSGAFVLKGQDGMGLNQQQRQQLRSDINNIYEGTKNAGRIMILEGDFKWQDMGLSPKDLDFNSGKQSAAREICQAFGVPPMLAGIPGDATFANYKEARFHLWEDTILPLLEFITAEFNLWLAPQFGPNLKLAYDLDSIAALAPRREAAWDKISKAPFLSANEQREAVGYSPV